MKKITKNSSITLVELPPTLFGKLDGDPGSDVYTQFMLPPRALPVLTGVLKNDSWTNVEMINPVFHGENKRLSAKNWQTIRETEVLGGSMITRTAPQTLALFERYKNNNP